MSEQPSFIELDVDSYRSQIRRYFQFKQLSREDVEDLEQEVICRMLESYYRFDNRSRLSTWLYSMCRNVLYEYYRKKKPCVQLQDEVPAALAHQDVFFDLEREVKNLPDHLKLIYHKRFTLEMSITEISKELSMPSGTVKYYIHHIKKMLKSAI